MTPRNAALAIVLATAVAGGTAGTAMALPTGIANPVCTESCAADDTDQANPGRQARGRGLWGMLDDSESSTEQWGTGSGRGSGQGNGNGQGNSNGTDDGTGTGQGNGTGTGQGNGTGQGEQGRASGGSGNGGPSGDHSDIPDAVPGATVSDDVKAELAYLAEEEKLAGDVYDLANELYGMRVFDNIGRAEDSHLAEVQVLLERYGVSDPTAGNAAGEFTDPDLQALYDSLAADVRSSRAEAVQAGITIEETDIADLETLLKNKDLPSDVTEIAANLKAGSERHLAAFQRQP